VGADAVETLAGLLATAGLRSDQVNRMLEFFAELRANILTVCMENTFIL